MKEGNFSTTKVVDLLDKNYPKLLAQISDPPKKLYYRGNLDLANQLSLAVVGSRKYSNYGKLACETIVGPISSLGVVIVSGLALGIDGIAHGVTLNNNGKTIAVLGSGIDCLTPYSHQNLAQEILNSGGLIVSEYPDGTTPTRYTFPMRNRIIAGLTVGCLVIEAAKKSGALITANCALDYNREVFAVPHPITSITGRGTNNLIKKGAQLVDEYQTILKELNIEINIAKTTVKNQPVCTTEEADVLKYISSEPKHIDCIAKQTKLDISTINGRLVLMEIKGIIKNVGEMKYVVS